MAFQNTTYHSRIYRDFKAIPETDYRRIVRHYERHEKNIMTLDFDEYFELLTTYTRALFEIAEYKKCALMSETVLQTSIIENVTHVNDDEIYCSTLFRKAACLYQLHDYAQAEHDLKELMKIQTDYPLSSLLLRKILRKQRPRFVQFLNALAIFLFLLSAMTICFEVVFIRHFYEQYSTLTEMTRNILFVAGLVVLLSSLTYHYLLRYAQTRAFIKSCRKTKAESQKAVVNSASYKSTEKS